MNKKMFFSLLMFSLFLMTVCSYSFATNAGMNNARNAVMDAGNAMGNTVRSTKNTVVNGTQNLVNGIGNLTNGAANGARNIGNDITNTSQNNTNNATTAQMLDNTNGDYNATRTATNNGLFGMSNNTWTWLIVGAIGVAIVGLVWYYSSRYEHRNYND